jgi:hypothetical protein
MEPSNPIASVKRDIDMLIEKLRDPKNKGALKNLGSDCPDVTRRYLDIVESIEALGRAFDALAHYRRGGAK